MKKTALLIISLIIISMPLFAQNWQYFPKTNVWEVFINEENAEFNNGLTIADEMYPDDEAIILRYYPSSNDLGNTDAQNVIDQYQIDAFPSAYFNSNLTIKGTKAHLQDGNPFNALIEKHLYDAAPMIIHNLAFNTQTNTVTCFLRDAEDSNLMTGLTLQYIVVENNVSGVNNVVRRIASDEVNFNSDGDILQFNKVVNLEQSWNVDNIKIIALVRNADNQIIQAASTEPIPFNKLRLVANEPCYAVSAEEFYELPYIAVMNTAFDADAIINFTINIEQVYNHQNWMITYCDPSNCFMGASEHTMSAGQFLIFHPSVMPNSQGSTLFNFIVTTDEMPELRIPFNFLTPSADILVIDDDGIKDTETAYIDGLDGIGMTYAIADMNVFKLDDFDFSGYTNIIWNMHNPYTLVENSIIPLLDAHVSEGANLYLAGTSAGWAMTNENSIFKNEATESFYNNVIGAQVQGVLDTNAYSVSGVASTAGDGFNLTYTQSPAEYTQIEPEYLNIDASARPIFVSNSQIVGLSKDYMFGKIIYTTFSIEGMDWQSSNSLYKKWLTRVMYELGNETSTDEIIKPLHNSLKITAYPNPFNQSTQIKIDSQDNTANIEIFNVKGQKVYQKIITINNGVADHIWNAQDAPSGIYFIKVNSDNQTQVKKVLNFK